MTMTESQQLLAAYVTTGSEAAFQELVTRYVDLVYSTALRLVEEDAHRARDVAQIVFTDLARLAAGLSPDSMLGGWLHRRTCFVARTVMRGERRRQARERQAVEMSALDNGPDTSLVAIATVLDEAINELGPDDRDAILLRFYEHRSLRSVGEALGTSENVAQKRVARAVQELAGLLKERGYSLSAAALVGGLAAGAVKAAPVGLAMGLAKAALAGSCGTGGITAAAKTVVLTKVKLGIAAVLIISGVATTLWLRHLTGAKRPRVSEPSGSELAFQSGGVPATSIAEGLVTQPPMSNASASAPLSRVEPRTPANDIAGAVSTRSQSVTALPAKVPGSALIQRYSSGPQSRLRVEGTCGSGSEQWQAETHLIGGFLEIDVDALQSPRRGGVWARAEAFVMVRSIKTVDTAGNPCSDKLDAAWCEALRVSESPKIIFYLSGLELREPAAKPGAAHTFQARGDLVMVGITNRISLPVRILPLEGGRLVVSGATSVDWVSEAVDPFAVSTAIGTFTPDRKVTVKFEWQLVSRNPPTPVAGEELVPLYLDLPAPMFKGAPPNLQLGSSVEPLSEMPRPPMLVPPGLKNLARDATITSSDPNATAHALAKIVDGDKAGADESILYLRKGTQWVQLDLGGLREIVAIAIWHAHNTAKVYHDVVVQVADDADFLMDVRTIFNNDQDNSSGLGKGSDREYWETHEGKLIDARGLQGRFLRFYSKGSTESALNEYTEIEVYGRAAR